jgi:hypothetical protein
LGTIGSFHSRVGGLHHRIDPDFLQPPADRPSVRCFLLHGLWAYVRPSACSTPPQLTPLCRKRSQEPQSFAGLIHKLVCAACKRAVTPWPKTPLAPPPVLIFTRGHRRTSGHAAAMLSRSGEHLLRLDGTRQPSRPRASWWQTMATACRWVVSWLFPADARPTVAWQACATRYTGVGRGCAG